MAAISFFGLIVWFVIIVAIAYRVGYFEGVRDEAQRTVRRIRERF